MPPKEDETRVDPPPADPPPADPPADSGGGDGADAALSTLVDEKVRDALAALGLTDDDDDDDHEGDDDVTTRVRSAAQTEASVEEIVKRELARMGKEKETDERISKVEKAIERPPVKQSRISRLVHGPMEANR